MTLQGPGKTLVVLTWTLLAFWVPDPVRGQVLGVVRDQSSLLPLAGALVTLQGTTSRTTSAADGSFDLPLAAGNGLTIVAALRGYYNAGLTTSSPAAGVIIDLEALPSGVNPSYNLWPPEDCGFCHEQPYSEWFDSPMARAGRNLWVHDVFNGIGTGGGLGGFVYTRDSVHASANPASECSACHQPGQWYELPFTPMLNPFTGPSTVFDGVACEVCHKISDVDESRMSFPGIYPGAVTIYQPEPPLFPQVQFGLLGDVTFMQSGVMRASYQPQLAAVVCGTCHEDKNDPDEDGDFEEDNGVLSEATYSEWLASPYGDPGSPAYRSCIDCHMPPSEFDAVCIVLSPPVPRAPGTLRSHKILGTTPDFLENAASLEVEAEANGTQLIVTATVTNDQTGHHLPTGVTIRNMLLLVEAWDIASGARLSLLAGPVLPHLAGVGDPQEGYFAGQPGRLYAKVNHRADGYGPVFFTEATGIISDTRIPALTSDQSRYIFQLPGTGGVVDVRARLVYRRSWRSLVDAKGWTTDGHGRPLADLMAPHYGHLMESAQLSIAGLLGSERFRRGDVDGSGDLQVADGLALLDFLFLGGAAPGCRDAADATDDGRVDAADVLSVLLAVFGLGPVPPGPGGSDCGLDTTNDWLDCSQYPASCDGP